MNLGASATSPGVTAPDLAPKHCPACGRRAVFRYTNAAEAAKKSPLCWGESERNCPGHVEAAVSQALREAES